MQSGLLSGTFTAARAAALPDGDWRQRSEDFHGDALVANLALAEVLGAIGQRAGTTAGAVAIAWTLAFPGVAGAIVGARSPDQVDGWISAAGLDLSSSDLDEISAAIERTGAGEGPTRP
jgi:aryl-alcohol dehydrogenase-like predicted oxidoreductase